VGLGAGASGDGPVEDGRATDRLGLTINLALTGTTGFVGGHLLEAALGAGHTVRALVRRPQPAREGVTWIEGALDKPAPLARLCEGTSAIIHVAGAINAPTRAAFFAANEAGTRALLAAAKAARVPRFVQVSSLAARKPGLSDYGASKAAADAAVRAAPLSTAIVRPPAVYGPGDRETLALFRLARGGIVPVVGQGRFSVIHVADLAAALLALATATATATATYEVADGSPPFTQASFAQAIAATLNRHIRIVPLPATLLPIGAAIDTAIARARGHAPKLSQDRARYFAHPDWTADPAPLIATGLWRPAIPAAQGLAETAAWYRAAGWL